MKVELFTICAGAYNNDGHLTIVDTTDFLLVSSVPSRVTFGLALKFLIEPGESVHRQLSVSVLSPDGAKVFDPEFKTAVNVEGRSEVSHFTVAINLQNVLFTKLGTHKVHLELDGAALDDFTFEVTEKRDA